MKYDNTIGKIIKDKKFYDKIRDMKVEVQKKEDDEKYKLLEYKNRN